MKIVINTCFGGFSIKKSIADEYGFSTYRESRTNKKLIELIESGIDCDGAYAHLSVKEIPDDATDYYIIENDGAEEIMYVVNGKIHFL